MWFILPALTRGSIPAVLYQGQQVSNSASGVRPSWTRFCLIFLLEHIDLTNKILNNFPSIEIDVLGAEKTLTCTGHGVLQEQGWEPVTPKMM